MTAGAGAGESNCPSVVILAAGAGTRFGGLKQLTEIGPDDTAIMDVLVRRAAGAGFAQAVIVVAPEMVDSVHEHLDRRRGAGVSVEVVVQAPVPGRSRPLGTAAAVLAARAAVDGSFVVVNGDDVYPAAAFAVVAEHLQVVPDEHVLVAFRVGRTLTGTRPVSRGLIDADRTSALVAVREGTVLVEDDGLQFETPISKQPLPANTPVSMNMWGFRACVFDACADAVDEFVASGGEGEVFLPDVVTSLVRSGATVRVLVSEEPCIGLTYPEDVAAVRRAWS